MIYFLYMINIYIYIYLIYIYISYIYNIIYLIYIYILDLQTPAKYQAFCTIRAFHQINSNISRSPEKLGAVCFPIQLSPLLSAKPSWLTCLCHLEWHPGWMAPFLLQPGRQVLIRSGYQTAVGISPKPFEDNAGIGKDPGQNSSC